MKYILKMKKVKMLNENYIRELFFESFFIGHE